MGTELRRRGGKFLQEPRWVGERKRVDGEIIRPLGPASLLALSLEAMDRPLPIIRRDPPPIDPTRIELLFDALVPRNNRQPRGLVVPIEPYLVRLGNLRRKLLGVSHRIAQWRDMSAAVRARFAEIVAAHPPRSERSSLPEGAVVEESVSHQDARLECEFEALLFSVRSTLDILTRVVSCFIPGAADLHSFNKLRGRALVPELADAGEAIAGAWTTWVADLRDRRDAAGHYSALSVRSRVFHSIQAGSDDPMVTVETAIQVPVKGGKKEGDAWEDSLPVWGPTSVAYRSIVGSDGSVEYAAELRDMHGELIVVRARPRQEPVPHRDADSYVDEIESKLVQLIDAVVDNLVRLSKR